MGQARETLLASARVAFLHSFPWPRESCHPKSSALQMPREPQLLGRSPACLPPGNTEVFPRRKPGEKAMVPMGSHALGSNSTLRSCRKPSLSTRAAPWNPKELVGLGPESPEHLLETMPSPPGGCVRQSRHTCPHSYLCTRISYQQTPPHSPTQNHFFQRVMIISKYYWSDDFLLSVQLFTSFDNLRFLG